MKTTHVDRAFVICIAAVLVLWTGCLVILWGWAFDTSGTSMLLGLVGLMFAVSAAVLLPSRAARAVQRVMMWLKLQDVLAMELAQAGAARIGKREARAITRILGVVTLIAVVCGLCSTLAILPGRYVGDVLGRKFLWAPLGWGLLKLAVLVGGMFPMAIGLGMTFLSAALLRGGSGRDVYASICRDWVWAVGVGVLVFGMAWSVGANLLGVALVTPVLLVALAMALFSRRRVTLRPRRLTKPIETSPQRRRGLTVAAGFAGMTMTLFLQLRLLSDVWGVNLPGRMVWVAFSLGLLGYWLSRADRRSRPPGGTQQIGAVVGVIAGLMIQSGLALKCIAARSNHQDHVTVVCALFAMALQVPMAALGALVLSRQRRLFALEGGRARTYAAAAALGAGLGFLGYLIACSLPAGHVVLLASGLGVLAVATIGGIAAARLPRMQLQWAGCGTVLMGVLGVMALAAIKQAHPGRNAITTGTWLTSVVIRDDSDGPPRRAGPLPNTNSWRSDSLTSTMGRIMNESNRRWWVVSTSDLDLPPNLFRDVSVSGSVPDPSAVSESRWRELLAPSAEANFLQAAQTSNTRFDGILLAPMPVDHPDAWRCYNQQALSRCGSRTYPSGLILLRTQAGPGYFAAALSLAKTFHSVVGSGWAVAEMKDGRLDLLLVGPAEAVNTRLAPHGKGVYVVSTERIWRGWDWIAPVRMESPSALRYRRRPSALRMSEWLDYAQ